MKHTASLSAKLVRIGAGLLVVALISIGLTLWVTWKLSGGAAALNEAGRMRMQTWRLTSEVQAQLPAAHIEALTREFDRSMQVLKNGAPSRPLFVPWNEQTQSSFARLQRSWGLREKFSVFAYQYWLAMAWKIGHAFSPGLGNRMTRAMARWLRCPTQPASISYRMNYPYAMQWFDTAGGFKRAAPVQLPMPMLYVYGARKPFMFHSPEWLDRLAAREGCAVEGLPCGHWVMVSQPEAFQARVRQWLDGQG